MTGVVAITSGALKKNSSYGSVETMTASTATTPQVLSVETDVSILGGSTTTLGILNNLYTLADGVHGQEKLIQHAAATGASSVVFDYGAGLDSLTATGQIVFQSDGDFVLLKFFGDVWHVISTTGATMATGT